MGHGDDDCRFSEGELSVDSGACPFILEFVVSAEGEVGLEPPAAMMADGKGGRGGLA